jgi:uncharacterized membrane protein YkvI
MKKLLAIIVLGFIFSNAAFANIVPLGYDKFNIVGLFLLTGLVKQINTKNIDFCVLSESKNSQQLAFDPHKDRFKKSPSY